MFNLFGVTLKAKIDKNTIIHLIIGGVLKNKHAGKFQRWADKVHEMMLEIHKKTGKKVRFFTDASKLKSMEDKIITIYEDLLKKDMLYVYKSATYGASVEIMAKLTTLMVTSGRANFQHFSNQDKAWQWLMSEEDPLK